MDNRLNSCPLLSRTINTLIMRRRRTVGRDESILRAIVGSTGIKR
jgi:hypothetical protein